MKLNSDVGEGFSTDKSLMPFIGQANIACGLHAGDAHLMAETIKLAKKSNVQIGAHPSYNDRENFGRLPVSLTVEQIKELVCFQVGALQSLARLDQVKVEYVKPHGALYNQMMQDETIFSAIVEAISSFETPLKLMILARPDLQRYQQIAKESGVILMLEAFADRAYDDAGYLVNRSEKGAVLASGELVEAQVKQLVETSTITTINGNTIKLQVDSICVHGDNPIAVKQIQKLAKLI
ncbi:MAG: LamB/YcsF family protein [Psychromonas sp.]|nr:LamB/YcsF family protein [Alteromonadales bacterium]MCP5078824.1 LamB/YcsF family protein [Psychromonas sp.]